MSGPLRCHLCHEPVFAGNFCQCSESRQVLTRLRREVREGIKTDWSDDMADRCIVSNHREKMLTTPHWRAPQSLQFLRVMVRADEGGFAFGAGKHRGLPFYLTHDDFPDVFRRAFPPQDESAA